MSEEVKAESIEQKVEPVITEEVKDISKKSKRYAGLKPIKKGEVRNPNGHNGSQRKAILVEQIEKAFGEFIKDEDGKKSKIGYKIVLTMAKKAASGDVDAAKLLWSYIYGKPSQEIEGKFSMSLNDGFCRAIAAMSGQIDVDSEEKNKIDDSGENS